jgi:hypothetical protein
MGHNVRKTINGEHSAWLSTPQASYEVHEAGMTFQLNQDTLTNSVWYVNAFGQTVRYTVYIEVTK